MEVFGAHRRVPWCIAPCLSFRRRCTTRRHALSWNEIKHRAIAFSKDWKDETREDAEAKSFWDAFFNVFGVQRRLLATFEEPVKKLTGDWAYIDLFWSGTLLAEHKSAGKDLGKAHAQGMEYIRALASSGRGKEAPHYLIVSDFQRIAIHDLEPEQDPDAPLFHRLPPSFEFPLADFHKHIRHFFFIAGHKQHRLNPEDPANEEATQLMCDLHDAFGQFYKRIPLRKSPHIRVANALRLDWRTVLAPAQCSYILGNPPFVGKHYQSKEQRADMVALLPEFGNVGDLDFVSGWYFKAADYIQGTEIKVGLVSTNSITQGEQVSVLWPVLFDRANSQTKCNKGVIVGVQNQRVWVVASMLASPPLARSESTARQSQR